MDFENDPVRVREMLSLLVGPLPLCRHLQMNNRSVIVLITELFAPLLLLVLADLQCFAAHCEFIVKFFLCATALKPASNDETYAVPCCTWPLSLLALFSLYQRCESELIKALLLFFWHLLHRLIKGFLDSLPFTFDVNFCVSSFRTENIVSFVKPNLSTSSSLVSCSRSSVKGLIKVCIAYESVLRRSIERSQSLFL